MIAKPDWLPIRPTDRTDDEDDRCSAFDVSIQSPGPGLYLPLQTTRPPGSRRDGCHTLHRYRGLGFTLLQRGVDPRHSCMWANKRASVPGPNGCAARHRKHFPVLPTHRLASALCQRLRRGYCHVDGQPMDIKLMVLRKEAQ
jgi:hypothetical protein